MLREPVPDLLPTVDRLEFLALLLSPVVLAAVVPVDPVFVAPNELLDRFRLEVFVLWFVVFVFCCPFELLVMFCPFCAGKVVPFVFVGPTVPDDPDVEPVVGAVTPV